MFSLKCFNLKKKCMEEKVLLKSFTVGPLKNDRALFYRLKCNCHCEILHIRKQIATFQKIGKLLFTE